MCFKVGVSLYKILWIDSQYLGAIMNTIDGLVHKFIPRSRTSTSNIYAQIFYVQRSTQRLSFRCPLNDLSSLSSLNTSWSFSDNNIPTQCRINSQEISSLHHIAYPITPIEYELEIFWEWEWLLSLDYWVQ
jgi:hypothetical protein